MYLFITNENAGDILAIMRRRKNANAKKNVYVVWLTDGTDNVFVVKMRNQNNVPCYGPIQVSSDNEADDAYILKNINDACNCCDSVEVVYREYVTETPDSYLTIVVAQCVFASEHSSVVGFDPEQLHQAFVNNKLSECGRQTYGHLKQYFQRNK